uniref:Uncharacterized protein n=1 Tax=Sipha flava TaxID=143950 RepID=A0A2S2R2C5_9HEMI
MLKTALLMWVTVALVTALSVVPASAAKKHKEESTNVVSADGHYSGNDIVNGGGDEAKANDHDGKRFPVRHVVTAEDELSAAATEPAAAGVQVKSAKQQSSAKQHNAKLLNRLGMKRVRTNGDRVGNGNGGANHHRKRLASQSRSKYAAGGADGKGPLDSQMFVVKLPPHAHFYDDGSMHQKLQHHQNQQTPYKSLNTVPVGFVSNGKPAKVYHWNLPTIKHALQGGRFKNSNDMHHHQYKQPSDFDSPSAAGSKIVPRRTFYYKPRAAGKPVKKSFVNNGKPNGFYVVSSKNAAAVPQYHKIVKAYYGGGDD